MPAVAALPEKDKSIEMVSNGIPVFALTGTGFGALIVAPATCAATPSTKVVSTAFARIPSPLIVATFWSKYPLGASEATRAFKAKVTSEFAEMVWWSQVIVRLCALAVAAGFASSGVR